MDTLTSVGIDEFKAIYRDECGHDLSDDEAQEMAARLLRFFAILHRPLEDDGGNTGANPQRNPQRLP